MCFGEELRQYIQLQGRLVRSVLSSKASEPLDPICDLPRSGETFIDEQRWSFFRHGTGLRFQSDQGVVVDVPTKVTDPEVFDIWRLRTYLGSLGRRGVKCIEKSLGERGVVLDNGIERLLDRLRQAGVICAEGECYRVMSADTLVEF
jgi:hypothetical protein